MPYANIEDPHRKPSYVCLCSIYGLVRSNMLIFAKLCIPRGGRVVQRCWVNFQCWGVLLIGIIVGQGPSVLAVGAGGGCLDIFSLIYHFSSFSLSLGDGQI